jgi:transposase
MMNTRISDVLHIGVDVAKDDVVVACEEEAFAPRTLLNQHGALLVWLKTLPASSRIGMEATGSYHRLLASVAFDLGLVVYVLNPRDCRHYAKGVGLRAKTDRVDARLIARIIAREAGKLHPWCAPSAQQQEAETLLTIAADPKHLGAQIGATLVLHTWGSKFNRHKWSKFNRHGHPW